MFVENKLYGLKTIIDDYSLFLYQLIYPYMKKWYNINGVKFIPY